MKIIHDTSTRIEREERSKIKDEKFRKMLREITYENEGVVFLKSLNNACLKRLQNHTFYQVQ